MIFDRRYAFMLVGFTFGCGAASAAPPAEVSTNAAPAAHFHDEHGRSIGRYEAVWPVLEAFFGNQMPARVRVERDDTRPSHFDPRDNVVYVNQNDLAYQSEAADVAHETSHLSLAVMTRGASFEEPFRFLDEGLASIIQMRVDHKLDTYRTVALVRAAGRLRSGSASVKIRDLQAWRAYFGDPNAGHGDLSFAAYEVGTAFDLFLVDRFGEAKLRELFVDLGKTRSLAESSRAVLGLDGEALESAWETYLANVTVRVPQVVSMVPANDATGVGTDLREAQVSFDVDMSPSCRNLLTPPCTTGLCFEHARWKDARTLAIVIDRPLLPSHPYEVTLGTHNCLLRSQDGVELPQVTWRFLTR